MTGDLTLGTDKITLDATDGSATFTGNVTLPGGGGDTEALQKQEIQALIDNADANVIIGNTPPLNPTTGDLWYNSDDGRLYVYYTDADSSQWVDASPDGRGTDSGGASVTISDTAPTDAEQGNLWWLSLIHISEPTRPY